MKTIRLLGTLLVFSCLVFLLSGCNLFDNRNNSNALINNSNQNEAKNDNNLNDNVSTEEGVIVFNGEITESEAQCDEDTYATIAKIEEITAADQDILWMPEVGSGLGIPYKNSLGLSKGDKVKVTCNGKSACVDFPDPNDPHACQVISGGCGYHCSDADIEIIDQSDSRASSQIDIVFLHHSTGEVIWDGGVEDWFEDYNDENETSYQITEQDFPKDSPYGWENYPYDYWNIWINNAGDQEYLEEPTLEILTKQYDVIVWKHCYPVSSVEEDTGSPSISSNEQTIENYKLQYAALKNKMKEFPNNKFIVWTGAALVQGESDSATGRRAQEFFNWVKNDWDEPGDNIFIWDFWALETEGGPYLKNEYAADAYDSHPNESFAETVAPYFGQRVVDVVEDKGDSGNITGKH